MPTHSLGPDDALHFEHRPPAAEHLEQAFAGLRDPLTRVIAAPHHRP